MYRCGPPVKLQGRRGSWVRSKRVIRDTGAGWGGVVVFPHVVSIFIKSVVAEVRTALGVSWAGQTEGTGRRQAL